MRLPPYWQQQTHLLPDPAANFFGFTNFIPKGTYEAVDLHLQIGESALVSIIDVPPQIPTHDGLFYVARTGATTYQINTLASRQVVSSNIGGTTVIENKGISTERYKWSVIHLI